MFVYHGYDMAGSYSEESRRFRATRRKFIGGLGAVAAWSVASRAQSREQFPSLVDQVERLPEATPEEQRKKAALLWGLENAEAGMSAGLGEDTAALFADVQAAVTKPIGKPAAIQTTYAGLFPKIQTPHDNPWLIKTIAEIEQMLAKEQKYPRGSNPEGKDLGTTYLYPYALLSAEAGIMTQALGNPSSPLYGNATLVAPILRRFEACFEILTPGSKYLADFGISPHLSEMYCLLMASFPALVLPSRKVAWEAALRRNLDAILFSKNHVFGEPDEIQRTTEQRFLHPVAGQCYPNAQSHLMNAVLFGGIVLGERRFIRDAEAAVEFMATAFYPDGGTAYISLQNECFTYHGIMIEDLARLWQVTGNAHARRLIKDARWYYPLSITPQGIAEYSSAPCWKHYWNRVKGASTAQLIASLENCEYNARVAADGELASSWLTASTYVSTESKPWWDNAITYDANLQGARGRFGAYSFCATARNTGEGKRPKLTYVGNLLVDEHPEPHQKSWPLAAGIDAVWTEVQLNDKPETVNRWNTHACLTAQETTATIVAKEFASLVAIYRLGGYDGQIYPWRGRQRWLLTRSRMVGALELESLEDQEVIAMGVAVKTVSGRGDNGIRKEWKQVSDFSYEYGPFTVRLWPVMTGEGKDLVAAGHKMAGYTDTFSGNEGKCGLLTMTDSPSATATSHDRMHYAKETRVRALVEIYPTHLGPAKVSPLDSAIFTGFQIWEPGYSLTLLHNDSAFERIVSHDELARWNAEPVYLHREGERYRLPFLPAVATRISERVSDSIRLVAGEHIVLRHV